VCRYTTRSIRSYSIQIWLKMSSHSTNIQFKSILYQVLKMTPFCSYTGDEHARHWSIASSMTFCPMLCHTLNRRWHVLVDVIYAFLVDPFLHYSPDLIIHGVHIWAVRGPLVGRNKVWVSRRKSAILSRALCAGALSCWNMKLSPDISLMHGSSFSFSSISW